MVQIRNLNVDPDAFLSVMPEAAGRSLGARAFLESLRRSFPQMSIGSFSHYVK